ncbi:KxYKxGKxW signal peptide domain-containing protein [Lacticaseibacillus absianus]|uniref:KxYKxGKxW signal peptide domain-containing protein n=1 Tax=Lacticaseibacillus absianus TaxID=2729623 RepID=UPI0015C7429A|nr:KxYKxGKxW signal peptide domain-containing protein [Lacticaseibacillus absianus]
MKDRQGAKKLYKAHKTWIAAGVAAATLFSVQALGTQTVSASETAPVATSTTTKADLLAAVASVKSQIGSIGGVKDTVTNKTFYGDVDAINAQVESGAITTKEQLLTAMLPMANGYKEYAKAQAKQQLGEAANLTDPETGRTFNGDMDNLFNTAAVSVDPEFEGVRIDLDTTEYAAVLARAKAATTKTIKVDFIDTTSESSDTYLNVVVQTSFTVGKNEGVSLDKVFAEVPAGYRVDKTKVTWDQANNKYYIGVYNVQALQDKVADAAAKLAAAAKDAKATVVNDLLARIQDNKDRLSEYGEETDTATGRTFNGDFDYAKQLVNEGKITSRKDLYNYLKPVVSGVKELLKSQGKAAVAPVGEAIDPETGRTFNGDIDYLFNSAEVKVDDDGVYFDLDYDALKAVTERVQALKAKIAEDAARGGNIADTPNKSTIASDAARGGSIADTPNKSTIASDAARGGSIADTPNLSTLASEKAAKAAEAAKTPTPTPVAKKTVKAVAATTPAAKAAKAALPQTGDSVNPIASSLGVVAVIGALFGLAGTSLKKRA